MHAGIGKPLSLPTVSREPRFSLVAPALVTVYEQAAYELSVDYSGSPPPPVLAQEDEKWMRELLRRVT